MNWPDAAIAEIAAILIAAIKSTIDLGVPRLKPELVSMISPEMQQPTSDFQTLHWTRRWLSS
jgi:hypothetical protein